MNRANAALREASKIASRSAAQRPPVTIIETASHELLQVGGNHYRDSDAQCPHCRKPIQLWDILRRTFFNEGSAIKHIFRHRTKNGLQDLLKARQYIDKIIATEYPDQAQ